MLTYEEQRELNTNIYKYTIDEPTLNKYLNRGNKEEIKFNRDYIIGAFQQRLSLFDNSEGYTTLVKLFIKTFLVNGSVYCKDDQHKRTEWPPSDYYRNKMVGLYDDITGKFLTLVKRPEFSTRHIDVYPSINLQNGSDITMEFNKNALKNFPDAIFVHNVFKLVCHNYETEETRELYKQLNTIFYNDDADELIDLINNDESIATRPYYINKGWYGITLFEFAILIKAMKCFKYLLLNNIKDRYCYIESALMRSNNVEAYRIIMNTKPELICIHELAIRAIRLHENDFFKHLYYNHDLKESIYKFVIDAITNYNYDIMTFLTENNELEDLNLYKYPLNVNYKHHMVAILYLLEKYNFSITYNWAELLEYLIASSLSIDRVMDIMRKVNTYVDFNYDTHKRYLLKCFQMKKPKEYIDKIVEFIYGHKQLNYSEIYDIYAVDILKTLYRFHQDINIITFIEIMFTPDYKYTDMELTEMTALINKYPDYNKELKLVLQFYKNQLSKHTM